jgi:hypothetical protein
MATLRFCHSSECELTKRYRANRTRRSSAAGEFGRRDSAIKTIRESGKMEVNCPLAVIIPIPSRDGKKIPAQKLGYYFGSVKSPIHNWLE